MVGFGREKQPHSKASDWGKHTDFVEAAQVGRVLIFSIGTCWLDRRPALLCLQF